MNSYDLSGKRILLIGGETGLDNAILTKLKECADEKSVSLYNQLNIANLEADMKSLVKEGGSFDGVIFNIVHSDFRPLQFVKPDLVNEIMNDNYGVFVEVVRSLKKCRGLNSGASIVAMSSISSTRAMKAKMAFCASKERRLALTSPAAEGVAAEVEVVAESAATPVDFGVEDA